MVVRETPVGGAAKRRPVATNGIPAGDRLRAALASGVAVDRHLPRLVAGAVLLGMAFIVAVTPIGSGDYGQWLMTSRPFLGETAPSYRDLGGVPPVVPILIAVARTLLPDPVAALHLTAVLLLVGLGGAMYLLGATVAGGRWAGALTLVMGLLVTDRFTELFAFGGLLQAGSLVLAMVSIATFVRAAREPSVEPRTWWIGVGTLGLAAISHVGTATIVLPAAGVVAGLALLARPERDFDALLRRLRLPLIGLVALGLFWLLVLRVESTGFVSNPASLAYRGPDRLWELLLERWPTTLVLVVGSAGIGLGAVSSLVQRRFDGWVALAAWSLVTWFVLAYAIVSGSATDYPRFTTPLLAPLVVGAAGALLWSLRALAATARDQGLGTVADLVLPVAVVGIVLVATPFAIDRHGRQASFYALRDVDALVAASAWIDTALDPEMTVMADTREAKWVEGLTGRSALFSQSVRYAFRSDEWQRSVEADALLRSSETLTSGLVSAGWTDDVGADATAAPTGLQVRVNHGGEMVELLRIAPQATILTNPDGVSVSAADLAPAGTSRGGSSTSLALVTRWSDAAGGPISHSQTVNAYINGSTLRITQRATGRVLTTLLATAPGLVITSMEVDPADGSAVACYTLIGPGEPCVRIHATQADAEITAVDRGIQVQTTFSERLDILVTALTAGAAAVDLQFLDPTAIAEKHDVGAAVLYAADPAYATRAARLAAIGFVEGPAFGPYRVLVREDEAASP